MGHQHGQWWSDAIGTGALSSHLVHEHGVLISALWGRGREDLLRIHDVKEHEVGEQGELVSEGLAASDGRAVHQHTVTHAHDGGAPLSLEQLMAHIGHEHPSLVPHLDGKVREESVRTAHEILHAPMPGDLPYTTEAPEPNGPDLNPPTLHLRSHVVTLSVNPMEWEINPGQVLAMVQMMAAQNGLVVPSIRPTEDVDSEQGLLLTWVATVHPEGSAGAQAVLRDRTPETWRYCLPYEAWHALDGQEREEVLRYLRAAAALDNKAVHGTPQVLTEVIDGMPSTVLLWQVTVWQPEAEPSENTGTDTPFSFTGREFVSLEEAVFQALGYASMCWSRTPQGVFDDLRAKQAGEVLLAYIREWAAKESGRAALREVNEVVGNKLKMDEADTAWLRKILFSFRWE